MKEAIREMLAMWDKYRALWIAENGNDDGFQGWFTNQVINTDLKGE